jgi:hypothetical protein
MFSSVPIRVTPLVLCLLLFIVAGEPSETGRGITAGQADQATGESAALVIRGSVEMPAGVPVAGARVLLMRPQIMEPIAATTTDNDGFFQIEAPVGLLVLLQVSGSGGEPIGGSSALADEAGEATMKLVGLAGLDRYRQGARPRVEWDQEHAYLNQVHGMGRLTGEAEAARRLAGSDEYAAAEKLGAVRQQLAEIMRSAQHPVVQAFAGLHLIETAAEHDLQQLLAAYPLREILDHAPVSSPVWGKFPPLLIEAIGSGLGEADMISALEQCLERNPDPYVRADALIALIKLASRAGQSERELRLFERFMSEFRPLLPEWFSTAAIDPGRQLKVGKKVPAFTFGTEDGGVVTDSDLEGRYTLLSFWSTWWRDFEQEITYLDEVHQRFSSRADFQILSVTGDNVYVVKDFRDNKYPMPWAHAYVAEGSSRRGKVGPFELPRVPYTLLVNPQGTILALDPDTRGENLLTTLTRHLPASSDETGG